MRCIVERGERLVHQQQARAARAARGRWRRAASRRPTERAGRRSSRRPMPSRSTTRCDVARSVRRRREDSGRRCRFRRTSRVREQPRLLEDVADAALCFGRKMSRRSCRRACGRRRRCCPLVGPDQAARSRLTSEVLPEPDAAEQRGQPRRRFRTRRRARRRPAGGGCRPSRLIRCPSAGRPGAPALPSRASAAMAMTMEIDA